MDDTTLVRIPLDQLVESPFNPRRTFNEAGLAELAADIKEVGVQQPLLVRPRWSNPLHAGIGQPDDYEIVFGHRRYRASLLAGVPDAPCMVRKMLIADARRVQISENLQREDVHPIEEAEGFQALMNDPDEPISADGLAEQLGKSRSYVYGRLKLLQACKTIRDACLAGEIGSEVALLIARLRTDKLQEKALGYIKGKFYSLEDGGQKSFRQIRDLLAERFTLGLKKTMFEPEDATLLPSAGACGVCPKRAGNAPEFADLVVERKRPWGSSTLGDPDVCTDPDCFDAKKKAHLKREAAALAAKGKTVIDGAKARVAIGADGKVKGAYVALKDVREQLKAYAKSPRKSMAGQPIEVQPVIIQNPRDGKTVEAVRIEDLKAAGLIKEAPAPKRKADDGTVDGDWSRKHQEREARAKAATEGNKRLLNRVRAELIGKPLGIGELRMVARAGLDAVYSSDDEPVLEELWGSPLRDIEKRVPDMEVSDLTLLLLDCALVCGVEHDAWRDENERPGALMAAADRLGVDAEAVRRGDETASTPSTAARAPNKAAAGAGAKKAKAARASKPATKSKAEPADAGEVIDEAGSAGERDPHTHDMLEETRA